MFLCWDTVYIGRYDFWSFHEHPLKDESSFTALTQLQINKKYLLFSTNIEVSIFSINKSHWPSCSLGRGTSICFCAGILFT